MATLFDSASLVMIPSGVKEDKLYSIKPTDGSGDFTFSRGSDIQATRVNASGLIEKAKVNLLLQSNSFPTASWDVSSVTLTGSQSGYDGSSDAWKLESNVTNANIFQIISTSGVSTFSVYAKAGNASWIRLRYDNTSTTDVNLWCNLTDGSLGVDNGVSSYTENIGGGWYRIVVQANTNDLNNLRIYPSTSDGGNSNTGDNIYIQDAALCHGLIAQDYVETTTTAVVEGLTADLPRLDYSGGASCPSLLLEPSRTNLIEQSEYFNSSYWIKGGAPSFSITDNAGTSPEGVGNATRFVAASAAASTRLYTSITWTAVPHTISVYVKNNGGTNSDLRFSYYDGSGQYFSPTFTLTNEWQRIEYTFTPTASAGGFWLVNSPTAGLDLDLLVYGAQLEVGSYPTSYIPTYGTAAVRGADTSLGQSIGLGNSHTIFFNGVLNSNENNKVFMELVTSGGSNSATIRNVIGYVRLYNQIDGNYPLAAIQSTNNKWVMRIDSNTYTLFYNNAGTPASQSGSFATARDMDKINIKGGFGELTTNQVLAFNTALTDSECNALVQ